MRLYNAAHDPGMKDMLSFLIARDTMHQQQWLAVIEELGGNAALPIPNSFDQSLEKQEFSYAFFGTDKDANRRRLAGIPPVRRWTAKASSRRCRRHPWVKSRCLARRGRAGAQKEQM